MATDRARRSFDAARKYRSVVSQQGRVTLEADANEAEEIRSAESRAELIDIVGPTGAPGNGFRISVPASGGASYDFAIDAGALYAGGVRVDTAATTYLGQSAAEWADYPAGAANQYPSGSAAFHELIFLSMHEQDVVAVEDPALREVALGGPDTAGRTRLIQRVLRAVTDGSTCEAAVASTFQTLWSSAAAFDPRTMRLSSTLQLRAGFVPVTGAVDLCQPTAQAGFLGAENQLIRVQVSRDDTTGVDHLLWGYDNASFLYRVTASRNTAGETTLQLDGTPVDGFHRPRAGQWVEILEVAVKLDAGAQLAAHTGLARQLRTAYDPTSRSVTLETALPARLLADPSRRVFLRMWENRQPFAANATTAIDLANPDGTGIGVRVWTQGTARVPGDYWMIGVRPSVPDALFPARLAAFQPPDGPNRWVVPLAVISWRDPTTADVSDCRRVFCPLVCDDDDDLEFHNKHLHGWGVVCGLQVHCMTTAYAAAHQLANPREWVIVRDGYAIDPTGKDIRLRSPTGDKITALHLADLARVALGGTIGDGAVSLWIDPQGAFHVEPYTPKKPALEDLLEGTILLDIWNDCIGNVFAFGRDQLAPATGEPPGGPSTQRLVALINLLAQLIPQLGDGSAIYLSGERDPATQGSDKEDALLRTFFAGLKDLLQSKTFCAMFDDVTYPDYDVYRDDLLDAPHPTTIFGPRPSLTTGFHSRIRVHPRRPLAFTCGNGGKLNIFHVTQRKLLASVDFLAPDARVQDVAFAATGDELYAVASTGTAGTQSTLLAFTVTDTGVVTWGSRIECNLTVASLATSARTPGVVYAAARGSGIYAFEPARGTAPVQIAPCLATGHLAVDEWKERPRLFAGAHTTDSNPVAFDQVLVLTLSAAPPVVEQTFWLPPDGNTPGIGHDDLFVISDSAQLPGKPCAIIDGAGSSKRLVLWDSQTLGDPQIIQLGSSQASRIAYCPTSERANRIGWAMITYESEFVGRAFVPGQETLVPEEIHPLQLGPASIATDADGNFLVLELLTGAITVIPAAADPLQPWRSTIDVGSLRRYRRNVIAAFLKAIGRLVQYLKDCICEHLLVDCPDGIGKVYLADISFKDGTIYQICNFHHRKYVHTFPTVEYWLSFVPVIPLLKYVVEQICCTPIAGWFDTLTPGDATNNRKTAVVSATMVRNGLTYLDSFDLKGQLQTRTSQVKLAGMFGKMQLDTALRRPSAGNASPPASALDVVARSTEEAKKAATSKGIAVRDVKVSHDTLETVLAIATAPPLTRGATVDLITDPSGRVLGWKTAAASAPPAAPAIPATPAPTSDEVAALRRELAAMADAHAKHAATVTDLHAQLTEMAKKLATIRP